MRASHYDSPRRLRGLRLVASRVQGVDMRPTATMSPFGPLGRQLAAWRAAALRRGIAFKRPISRLSALLPGGSADVALATMERRARGAASHVSQAWGRLLLQVWLALLLCASCLSDCSPAHRQRRKRQKPGNLLE